jgi:hypothetical protein
VISRLFAFIGNIAFRCNLAANRIRARHPLASGSMLFRLNSGARESDAGNGQARSFIR